MADVDDYLATLDEPARSAFEHVREITLEIAPKAVQGKSYGVAALKLGKKPLLGFLATRQHLSLFPFSGDVVAAVEDRLAGFDVAKGTIRFTAGAAIPDDVLRDIVRLRLAEIDGSAG